MKKKQRVQNLPADASYDEMDSPVGKLTIITSEKGLHAILWDVDRQNRVCDKSVLALHQSNSGKVMTSTKKQLMEYFNSKRKAFDLPLAPTGTDFQRQAWQQLQKIPYGKTISYGEQARRLGDKNKARAVGLANGCNPISIVVPCHRVIGANGKLVGFGGGLDRKAVLLALEKANC